MESLRNVYGEIAWSRRPWPQVQVRPGADELSCGLSKEDRLIVWTQYAPSDWPHPDKLDVEGLRFYERVVGLQSAFCEENWEEVADFYGTYGPLGDPAVLKQKPLGERVGWCRHALAWFGSLVRLVELLQTEDDAGLWLWFESCLSRSPGGSVLLDLVQGSFPGAGLLDERFSRIELVPQAGHTWPGARERQRLYDLMWGAVIDAVQGRLADTHLEPFRRVLSRPSRPVVQWGFAAGGALDAAFLQWFFEIFAPFQRPTCERPGCDRPLPVGRRKYCCPQCANAHRKQRQRERERVR